MFDLNDFDETIPGPWEWDLKRLATSLEVAGRDRGFLKDRDRRTAGRALRVRGVPAGDREFAEDGHAAGVVLPAELRRRPRAVGGPGPAQAARKFDRQVEKLWR